MYKHERKVLERIKKRVKSIIKNQLLYFIAFGSRVRGDHKLWSDFDVLVVVKNKDPEIEHTIMDIFVEEELKSFIFFNPLIKESTSFELERKYNTPFYKNITEEGILI